MRRYLAVLVTSALALAVLLVVNSVAADSATPTPKVATIVIQNFTYTGQLTVHPNQRVRVENHDTTSHTATNPGNVFNTGTIPPSGARGFYAPKRVGNFKIRCLFHSFMAGTLHVVAP